MANAATNKAPGSRTGPQRQYWKVAVYPWGGQGGEPDKHVFVLGRSSEDALNRVYGLFPESGRLLAKKVRPSERYKGITENSALVERA